MKNSIIGYCGHCSTVLLKMGYVIILEVNETSGINDKILILYLKRYFHYLAMDMFSFSLHMDFEI